MKKILLAFVSITFSVLAMSQTNADSLRTGLRNTTTKPAPKQVKMPAAPKTAPLVPKKDWSKIDLSTRPADHIMIQFGSDAWLNRPDSVRTGGFSRHFNAYFMFDKPFKSNARLSLAFGVGIGSSNIFFDNTKVDLKSNSNRLPFTRVDSVDHFKKFKVTTIYAEIPVELRYYSDPEHPGKSWKAALGLKVGTLLKSYSKGKDLVNKAGNSIYGTSYVVKESNKRFLNSTMLATTARIGYGLVSLDVGYQINGVLKDGTGPAMNKLSIGITISGL